MKKKKIILFKAAAVEGATGVQAPLILIRVTKSVLFQFSQSF